MNTESKYLIEMHEKDKPVIVLEEFYGVRSAARAIVRRYRTEYASKKGFAIHERWVSA